MKKIILLLSVLAFFSCKKCKECYYDAYVDGVKTNTIKIGEYCGSQLSDIDGTEKTNKIPNVTTDMDSLGNIIYDTTYVTMIQKYKCE